MGGVDGDADGERGVRQGSTVPLFVFVEGADVHDLHALVHHVPQGVHGCVCAATASRAEVAVVTPHQPGQGGPDAPLVGEDIVHPPFEMDDIVGKGRHGTEPHGDDAGEQEAIALRVGTHVVGDARHGVFVRHAANLLVDWFLLERGIDGHRGTRVGACHRIVRALGEKGGCHVRQCGEVKQLGCD